MKIILLNTFKHQFKKPMHLNLFYDVESNMNEIINRDLALFAYGVSYTDALVDLDVELEGHILSFQKYPSEKHSSDSLILRDKLLEYIDFNY
jgi:hypothetical protein